MKCIYCESSNVVSELIEKDFEDWSADVELSACQNCGKEGI